MHGNRYIKLFTLNRLFYNGSSNAAPYLFIIRIFTFYEEASNALVIFLFFDLSGSCLARYSVCSSILLRFPLVFCYIVKLLFFLSSISPRIHCLCTVQSLALFGACAAAAAVAWMSFFHQQQHEIVYNFAAFLMIQDDAVLTDMTTVNIPSSGYLFFLA